jgi:hypothetical protein
MADVFLDLPGEVWKGDILYGVEGLEASSLGRLRRQPRWVRVNQSTDRLRLEPGHILSLRPDRKGYLYSWVSAGLGRSTGLPAHRVVCAAFHGAPTEERWNVCHINGDSGDNRAENLRWGSFKENSDDQARHNTRLLGERHPMTRLKTEDAKLIRSMALAGSPYSEIRKLYDVSPPTICNIKYGRTWRHLASG